MNLVAGLDVGGSGVKAWVAGTNGRVVAVQQTPLPIRRPARHRAEFDPTDWWATCRAALADAVAQAPGDYLGLTVSSVRQGFVLTDGRVELGQGVLNSDRRGAAWLDELRTHRQLYAMTRHWPAPELTLPKLLAVRAESPRRWADARRLLFVHDWLVWRLTGAECTEISYACAGQLAHVSQRAWAWSLLDDLDIPRSLLAPVVEAGTVVGTLREPGLGLPVGLPVVAGCGDTQLAAAGAGAAHPGVVCVVAGSSTPLLATADFAPLDPQQRPWVSTHAPRDTWAVETNCGYPGTMLGWLARILGVDVPELFDLARRSEPGARGLTAVVGAPHWTERDWATKPPRTLLGLDPQADPVDLAAAFTEGYAFAVRANLEDLEDVLGGATRQVVLTGGGAGPGLADLVATVTGREVAVPEVESAAALAGATLVATAVGSPTAGTLPSTRLSSPGERDRYEEPYQRYLAAYDALREHLPEADA